MYSTLDEHNQVENQCAPYAPVDDDLYSTLHSNDTLSHEEKHTTDMIPTRDEMEDELYSQFGGTGGVAGSEEGERGSSSGVYH